jgi:hypothetical protein
VRLNQSDGLEEASGTGTWALEAREGEGEESTRIQALHSYRTKVEY